MEGESDQTNIIRRLVERICVVARLLDRTQNGDSLQLWAEKRFVTGAFEGVEIFSFVTTPPISSRGKVLLFYLYCLGCMACAFSRFWCRFVYWYGVSVPGMTRSFLICVLSFFVVSIQELVEPFIVVADCHSVVFCSLK